MFCVLQDPPYVPAKADGVKESVYALAMNAHGTLVAVGSTEAVVRIVDARVGDKVSKGDIIG